MPGSLGALKFGFTLYVQSEGGIGTCFVHSSYESFGMMTSFALASSF